jgi:hypothetical protein
VSGRVIFAEDPDTGRSKCSANGSSCVSIDHIVLMRGRKSDISSGKKPKASRDLPFTTGAFGSVTSLWATPTSASGSARPEPGVQSAGIVGLKRTFPDCDVLSPPAAATLLETSERTVS